MTENQNENATKEDIMNKIKNGDHEAISKLVDGQFNQLNKNN